MTIIWPPDVKSQLIRKILILGKIEGRRRRGKQGMRWLDGITDSMDMSLSKFQEMVKDRGARHAGVHWVTKSWTQLSKEQQKTSIDKDVEKREPRCTVCGIVSKTVALQGRTGDFP